MQRPLGKSLWIETSKLNSVMCIKDAVPHLSMIPITEPQLSYSRDGWISGMPFVLLERTFLLVSESHIPLNILL